MFGGSSELDPTLSDRVIDGPLVDLDMPHVVPLQLFLERFEGAGGVEHIPLVNLIPVNNGYTAVAAQPCLIGKYHLLRLLKAMQVVFAL